MKKIIITFILLNTSLGIFAQIPALTFDWINNFGNTITCYDLKNDNSGNTFVCGSFNGTLTLPDTIVSSIDTNTSEIFLAKLDSAGSILWFRFAEGYGIDKAYSLALDTINNSVYISGSFYQKVSFENDTISPSNGYNHFFLAKYNFNGSYQWSRFARRAAGGITPSTIALDNYQNIVLVTEQGSGNIIFQDTVISTSQSNGHFFVKYDSNGNRLAAKLLTEGINYRIGHNLVIDSENNIVIFSNGGIPITSDTIQYSYVMIIKYDSNGVYQWSYSLDSTGMFFYPSSHANSIAIDKSDNIYITGEYFIDQGVTVSFFLYKISGDGNLIWDRLIPYSYTTVTYSSGVDILSHNDTAIFVALTINPVDYMLNFFGTWVINNGLYFAQFDSSGSFKTIKECLPYNLQLFFSIDKNENFYFGFSEVSKTGRDIILNNNILNTNRQIMIYPNPATDYIEIKSKYISENVVITITNYLGVSMDISYEKGKIDVSSFPAGLYVVGITDKYNGKTNYEKFIKL